MLKAVLGCCVTLAAASLMAASHIEPEVNGSGTLRAIRIDGGRFAISTGMNVASPQWKKMAGTNGWAVKETKLTREGETRIATGRMPFADSYVEYRQVITPRENGVRVRFEATPKTAAAAEGINFTMAVRLEDFIGGEAKLLGNKPKSATMPEQRPAERHFLSGAADAIELRKGERKLTILFDKTRQVILQDDREYKNDQYSLYSPIHTGDLVAGQTASAEVLITAEGPIDRTPVDLKVQPNGDTSPFDGFGGNFVYGADSPTANYNLDHLNVAWGRVWMPLHLWEPENDNAEPAATDLQKLAANDKPGTRLRSSLERARELNQRKIPYIASVWQVPRWMQSNPADQKDSGIVIPREKWEELAESITSYLTYARDHYGAEPDMFSFNEPDYGVTVKLTAEESRDMYIFLGQRFEKLGLKTRLLACDNANARGTAKYFGPTAASPEALKYVRAVAFHSWGGATPGQYGEWQQAAKAAGLPLLDTEAGVDAQAWHHPGLFGEYWYGLAEARQYIEILQYARPQGILLWEYTDDYGILKVDQNASPPAIIPTKRFQFVSQFATKTPRGGKLLSTSGSQEGVLFTAIQGTGGKLTLHILNDGPARPAAISGVSGSFDAFVTDSTRDAQNIGQIAPAHFELPACSLVTLVGR